MKTIPYRCRSGRLGQSHAATGPFARLTGNAKCFAPRSHCARSRRCQPSAMLPGEPVFPPLPCRAVLNSASNVTPGTRERVEQAIQELGYLPNVAARSLRSKRTHTLALLVPDITNVFWTTVARGVEDAAQSSGYSVFLCNTDENPIKQTRYLQAVASQQVDGVIIAPYASDASSLTELRERGVTTVLIDRRVNGWDVDTVAGDSVAGGRALVRLSDRTWAPPDCGSIGAGWHLDGRRARGRLPPGAGRSRHCGRPTP